MRIFLINLARRPDRLAHMSRQLSAFERIDAVDGLLVEEPCVSGFRFWCSKGYRIKPGEIGCAMSHQKIYRLMIDQNLPYACVLEDDVNLCANFAKRIESFATELDNDDPRVISFTGWTGAYGYLINRAGAMLLSRLNTPIRSTLDDWERWSRGGLLWRSVGGFVEHPVYGDTKAVGVNHSDIVGDARHFVANMTFGRKVLFKLGRVIGKTVDCLLR